MEQEAGSEEHAEVVSSARSGKATDVAKRQEDQAVAKANEAIAIRPRRGKLTLLSRRIYNVFLYHAQQQGVEKPSYSILLSELIDAVKPASSLSDLWNVGCESTAAVHFSPSF